MRMSPRSLSLYLALTRGIGGKTITRVMARNELLGRSPEDFLKLSPESHREEYRLSDRAAQNLALNMEARLPELLEMERRLEGLGVSWVTPADAHYPSVIEEMDPDPPGVLFLYGATRLLEARTVCILASRKTKVGDLDLIERFAEEAVLQGEVVVSGHDRPEYQRAAIVPLRWGAPRILCLDRGMFPVLGETLREEPFRAARLWRYEFDPKTDLVVSPFRPECEFHGVQNQVRDKLVACISRRLIFAQVAEGGNMAKLARLALRCGRDVTVSDRSDNYRELRTLGAHVVSP